MTSEKFLKAIQIISANHSTNIIINYATPNSTVKTNSKNLTIHISDCCASVINNLIEAGYSLSMEKGMTSVSYYK